MISHSEISTWIEAISTLIMQIENDVKFQIPDNRDSFVNSFQNIISQCEAHNCISQAVENTSDSLLGQNCILSGCVIPTTTASNIECGGFLFFIHPATTPENLSSKL